MRNGEASPIPIRAADISHAVAPMLAEVRGQLADASRRLDECLRAIRVQQRVIGEPPGEASRDGLAASDWQSMTRR